MMKGSNHQFNLKNPAVRGRRKKMNYIRVAKFKMEFPFLKVGENTTIQVRRLDSEVLSKKFFNYSWNGSMGSSEHKISVQVITEEKIFDDIKIGLEGGSNYAHSPRIFDEGESLFDFILKNKLTEKVKFVVVYEDGFDSWDQSTDSSWDRAIVYKLPKGESLSRLLEEKKEEEEMKIVNELNF